MRYAAGPKRVVLFKQLSAYETDQVAASPFFVQFTLQTKSSSLNFNPTCEGRFLETKLLCTLKSVKILSRGSYAWNYRELATLLTLSERLAEVGFEPLVIGSMGKHLTTMPS